MGNGPKKSRITKRKALWRPAPVQPPYTGPLYQSSLLSMEEKLDQKGHFYVNAAGALDLSNNRGEIVYVEGLTEDKTYCYDYRFVDLPDGNYQIVEDETM